MTGFGRGVAERVTVDLRAVNHRFLDIKLRAQLTPAIEDAIQQRLRATVERGAIAVSVHVERPRVDLAIDTRAAGAAHAALARLAHELDLPGPDLATILAQPGVVGGATTDPELDAAAILAATDIAITELAAMRRIEGTALAAELTARLDELAAGRARVAELAAAVPGELARRLQERLAKLVTDGVDPQRLAQEVAILADRADVTEELVRLASHLDQARALVAEREKAVGRRLDFLVQEIGRELNTIGSKSVRAEISTTIVDAKATLEKLREQVQNVE